MEFEDEVEAALETLPEDLREAMSNVAIVVEDEPPAGQPLLGLYEGVSLTERAADHTGLPDRITVFRRPLLEMCATPEELVREVRITVVHEIAHHFGIDDDRLHELGYG